MAREAFVPFLVTMMLVTGVCNTILNKYQDMQCVRNCDSPNPSDRKSFEQPVIQTAQMFVGELGCFLVVFISFLYNRFVAPRISAAPLFASGYRRVRNGNSPIPEYRDVEAEDEENEEYGNGDGEQADDSLIGTEYHSSHSPNVKPLDSGRRKLDGWRILMLAAPACCDILGTTMMNAGLLFVAASIYQMTRGALVLFVGLFSVLFLRRKLHIYQWSALVIVVVGVAIVGLSGALFGHDQAHDLDDATNADIIFQSAADLHAAARTPEAVRVIVGVLLIAAAQIFTATQFVLEEWILEHYTMDPLVVVGWEGFFGLSVTVLGMVILYLTIGVTDAGRYGYFDMKEGWRQVTHNRAVAVSSLLIMVSIGGFNFFGLSVTRTVSATSRSTIDTSRTLFIWLVSLGLGWETFKWLQVVGFALLVYGTFLFNDIIRPPLKACLPSRTDIIHEELLPEEPIEHI